MGISHIALITLSATRALPWAADITICARFRLIKASSEERNSFKSTIRYSFRMCLHIITPFYLDLQPDNAFLHIHDRFVTTCQIIADLLSKFLNYINRRKKRVHPLRHFFSGCTLSHITFLKTHLHNQGIVYLYTRDCCTTIYHTYHIDKISFRFYQCNYNPMLHI